jgi:hypothetical protein
MDWYHKTSYEWLDARRSYITASDIVKMLGVTATGRPKSPAAIEDAIRDVWATKQAVVREEDCESRGVMARGHLLERYAIDMLNDSGLVHALSHSYHHWDDAMVHSLDGVAFSPDALSCIQPVDGRVDYAAEEIEAISVAEVKSYNASSHYAAGMSIPKMQLPERWQLAAALYVMPTIDFGYLVLYNPGAKHQMFVKAYSRTELETELEAIATTAKAYWSKAADYDLTADVTVGKLGIPPGLSEADVCKLVIDEQSLCPEGLGL